MEKTAVLKEQLRNTNIVLNDLFKQQKELIIEYIKENKKVFVTDQITADENGNYELDTHIDDIDYFYVQYENPYNDNINYIKVVGFEYDDEYDDINVYYVDEYDDELLCGNFEDITDNSYRNIVNMLTLY